MSRSIRSDQSAEAGGLQALPVSYATRTMRAVLLAWAASTVVGFSFFAVFAERQHAGTALGILMTATSVVSAAVVNGSFDAVGVAELRRRFGAVMAVWLPWYVVSLVALLFLNSAFVGAPVVLGVVAALPLLVTRVRPWPEPSTARDDETCTSEGDKVIAILGGVEHLDERLTARLLGMTAGGLREAVRTLEEAGAVRVTAGSLRRRRLSLAEARSGRNETGSHG